MAASPLGIGVIGCGTVGAGVIRLLHEQRDTYAQRIGRALEIRKVLVRDRSKQRGLPFSSDAYTDNPDDLFNDEGIGIIVEVAGGIDPVHGYVKRALESGRHVVTANKALLAAHGGELFALARKHNVCIAFEASCGGTIPMLAALKFGLAANRIDAVYGILNGTCNYILSQMAEAGWTYAHALKDAQAKGYAEADPTLDVNGSDAAQKLAIVASLAFGQSVKGDDVPAAGIDTLKADDIAFGKELGYVVKLLAIAERRGSQVQGLRSKVEEARPDPGPGTSDLGPAPLFLRVEPCFVHAQEPLAQVRGAFNALSVFGHASGHVMLYGQGAGQMPTASAVVSDILNVAGGWYPQAFKQLRIWPDQHAPAKTSGVGDSTARFYLRFAAKDKPGVTARIAKALGDHGISISAIVQHEDNAGAFVPLVVTTHPARESDVKAAAKEITDLDAIRDDPTLIRIVDLPSE